MMTKKLFALCAFLMLAVAANAQFYVGGSFGFTSTTVSGGGSDESGSSFKIVPDLGYRLDDNMSVGVQVGYSHGLAAFGSLTVTDIKSAMMTFAGAAADMANKDMKLNSFTIAPYLRYSFLHFGKARLFIEAYVGYNNIKTDSTPSMSSGSSVSISGNEATINAFELGVRPGVIFSISEKFDVLCKMGALGYMSAKEKDSDMKISRFGVDADTYNLLVGMHFHF